MVQRTLLEGAITESAALSECGVQGSRHAKHRTDRRREIHLVIGMGAVLPQDSVYTVSAQEWADEETLRLAMHRLTLAIPSVRVSLGRANVVSTQVKVLSGTSSAGETAGERALTILAMAKKEVTQRLSLIESLPNGRPIWRLLERSTVEEEGCHFTEHVLRLMDLSPWQHGELGARLWTQTPEESWISLTSEAAEREEVWLKENRIIR